MIKLTKLIKEECSCDEDCCSTKLNENMEMGKVFTGGGFAFKNEEFDGVNENILKQIQQAEKIAKSMAGNMTGAVKGIEKIRRGLSRHKRVKVALKKYNEQEENDYLGKDYIKNESLYNVSQDMKDGKFDVKNPQVHISGYGVTNLKTLRDSLSRKFIDLAKKAKKGDVDNLEYLLKRNGVLMGFVDALVDVNKQLNSSQMKRKITMYKRKH